MYLSKLLAICLFGIVFAGSPSFSSNSNSDNTFKQMDGEASTIKGRLIALRDKEIDERTNVAQSKIQTVNEDFEMRAAGVPRFFYTAWGYPVPNSEYERTVAYMRVDAQKEINAINKDLMSVTKKINAVYQEKLNAIDSSVANVGSQIKPGTSEIQLSPVGDNLYVKNYVNYVADQPKPKGLKARQKSLACKTGKQAAEKDIKP